MIMGVDRRLGGVAVGVGLGALGGRLGGGGAGEFVADLSLLW
jgi:hypothetical protein